MPDPVPVNRRPLLMPASPPLVIDTHWVLDLWAFGDARAAALRAAIAMGRVRWLASAAMRAELARVLAYPRIAAALAKRAPSTAQSPECAARQTLAAFDRHAAVLADPPAFRLRCRDPDDQPFIDLAVMHRATLLSRDRAVLALARPLRAHGVHAQSDWRAPVGAADEADGLRPLRVPSASAKPPRRLTLKIAFGSSKSDPKPELARFAGNERDSPHG